MTADDRLLLAPLARAGVTAESIVWEDRYVDWRAYDLLVIRSTWDYAYRLTQFLAWVDHVARQVALWNPPSMLRANTLKSYLRELERAGVRIVPTRYLPAGSPAALTDLVRELGPETGLVVKPVVGNSGRWAVHVPPDAAGVRAAEKRIHRILRHEEMMVQPFLPEVTVSGEISLIAVEGTITHAVRKRPSASEFRGQIEYGGTETPVGIRDDLAIAMRRAMDHTGDTLYARADFIDEPSGTPLLVELELVEPDLFLRHSDDAIERMTNAVTTRL